MTATRGLQRLRFGYKFSLSLLCSYILSNGRSSSSCSAFDLFRSKKKTPTQLQLELMEKASQIRDIVGPPRTSSYDDGLSHYLYFESSFYSSSSSKKDDGYERGFCNWLIPNVIMVGQYPGQVPEVGGPSAEEVQQHISRITGSGVRLFCSLQSELPAQDDYETWDRNDGIIFLGDHDGIAVGNKLGCADLTIVRPVLGLFLGLLVPMLVLEFAVTEQG